jgi:hypothetical protein
MRAVVFFGFMCVGAELANHPMPEGISSFVAGATMILFAMDLYELFKKRR